MKINILTLFPSMFSPLEESIIGKAIKNGLIQIDLVDIRSFAHDKHKTADDSPYGGGQGMVMKPELLYDAVASLKSNKTNKIIYLSPAGRTLDQDLVKELAECSEFTLICGHYEGLDQRVIDDLVDERISIGDYVLTGGEIPAMVLVDAIARFIPGVLGDARSSREESFSNGLLEYPQYTKPAEYKGKKVPDILKTGNHKEISKWRRAQSITATFYERPELLAVSDITHVDMKTLEMLILGENKA